MMEVDHESQQVFLEQMEMPTNIELGAMFPSDTSVQTRLTSPIVTTFVDTENISFERFVKLCHIVLECHIQSCKACMYNFLFFNVYASRNKSGIWGWRSDKTEDVNGYSCKVFSCNNVALVTKTRTEHLSERDKVRSRLPRTPLHSFLGIAQNEQAQVHGQAEGTSSSESSSEVFSLSSWSSFL